MQIQFVFVNDFLISLVKARPVSSDITSNILKHYDATKNAWKEDCLETRNEFGEVKGVIMF